MTCIYLDKDLSACPRREIGPDDAPNRTPYPPENANDPLVSGIGKNGKSYHKDLLLTDFIIKVIWLNTVSKRKTPSEVLRICREAGVMTGLQWSGCGELFILVVLLFIS